MPNAPGTDDVTEVQAPEYAVEYLYSRFDLLGDEKAGMVLWLALVETAAEEWRLEDLRMLTRFIRGMSLSRYARGQVALVTADLYRQQQQWDDAIRFYDQAVVVFRDVKCREDEAVTLNNLALTLQDQRRYDEAIEAFQQAKTIYAEEGDSASLGRVLSNLGSVANEQGNWKAAQSFYLESVSELEQAGRHSDLASVYNNLAVACENLGKLDEAERWYRHSLDLLIQLEEEDVVKAARLLMNLGQLSAKRGDWLQAIENHRNALQICQDAEEIYVESMIWNNLGATNSLRGDYSEAASCFRRSVELHQHLKDRQGEAVALSNLGAAFADLGDLGQAETCYLNSMAASEDLQEPDGIARACNNLGVLCETRGQYDRAIGWYVRAADILHAVGEHHREVTALINLSSLYEAIWAQHKAAYYFDQAWEIAQQRDYFDHLATLCALRGNTAFQTDETYGDGYRWYARACAFAAQHDDQTWSTTIDRVEAHLARMLEQGRQVEAVRFRQVLADTNLEESTSLHNAKPAERWRRIAIDPDALGR